MKGKYRYFYGEFINVGVEYLKVIAKLSHSINEPREIIGKSFTLMYISESAKVFKVGSKGKVKIKMPDELRLYETAEECIGDHFEKFL